jgi:hypothetical protein
VAPLRHESNVLQIPAAGRRRKAER